MMHAMKTVHLISGLPCSGKTTYSQTLAESSDAVHLCLDVWLITLYGRYSIDEIGHPEHVRRVLACRELIWSMAGEFLKRDVDVVLDDGFFLREHRARLIAQSRALGAHVKIHYLNPPVETLLARLQARNARLPNYNFPITEGMFAAFVAMFEPPSPSEGAELVLGAGSPKA